MAVHESYLVFVLDQLGGAGEVVSKKMFGGAGIYLEGFMVGLIYQNSLYLRGGSANMERFKQANCPQFIPEAKTKSIKMPYWQVPEEVMEDKEELREWALEALAAAREAKLRVG